MFERILVPTDLTERSFKALEVALKIARHDEATVTLLHVVEMIMDTDTEDFRDFYEKLGRRANRLMDEAVTRFKKSPLPIDKQVMFGQRVKDIVSFAHSRDIDLIILMSHKIDSADSSRGWGTISYKVSILSHCPVMLVK